MIALRCAGATRWCARVMNEAKLHHVCGASLRVLFLRAKLCKKYPAVGSFAPVLLKKYPAVSGYFQQKRDLKVLERLTQEIPPKKRPLKRGPIFVKTFVQLIVTDMINRCAHIISLFLLRFAAHMMINRCAHIITVCSSC